MTRLTPAELGANVGRELLSQGLTLDGDRTSTEYRANLNTVAFVAGRRSVELGLAMADALQFIEACVTVMDPDLVVEEEGD